jgi:ABC-2 type transport system ATP-binding protein
LCLRLKENRKKTRKKPGVRNDPHHTHPESKFPVTTPIVEAAGVEKHYGDVHALAGLDLVAPAGRVTAVLGPNGAGKTTFVKAVATLLLPDAGRLIVGGVDVAQDPQAVRRMIGLAGQNAAVEPALTGRENLFMVARLFGHSRTDAARAAETVLHDIHLTDDADRPVKGYSGGMRRRLDLGASLVGAPKLLLLDEPTTGLDPRTRIDLWQTIRTLVAQGTSVLLTTQYLEEADQLADHVVIIDNGRCIARGTPSELKAQTGQAMIEVRVADVRDLAAVTDLLSPLSSDKPVVDEPARRITVQVTDGSARLADALRIMAATDIALDDLGLRRPTLDEVFLALTGASK